MQTTAEKYSDKLISPIIRTDNKHVLIEFKLGKSQNVTQDKKATFQTESGTHTLLFDKCSIYAGPEYETLFPAGKTMSIIAVKDNKNYVALTVCAKELFEYFERAYDSLESIAEAQKTFFGMPPARKNNIFLQLGAIEWSEELEVADLVFLSEYILKLKLCRDKIPSSVAELINHYLSLSATFHSEEAAKRNIVKDYNITKLSNFAYFDEEVKAVPKEKAAAYLKANTFLKPEDIEKLSSAMSQNHGRGIRVFLEGYENAGMDEVIDAISVLMRMPTCRTPFVGLSCAFELVGETKSFRESEGGIPVRLWNEAKTNRCLFVYENITSLGASVEHGSARATVKTILSNKTYFDEYFKAAFPMSKTSIVATGENFSDLYPNAQRMFDVVIHFEMSDEDKCEVIKEHYLEELSGKKYVVITDDALQLAAQYSDDFGLKRTIEHVRVLIAEADMYEIVDKTRADRILSGITIDATSYVKYKLQRSVYSDEVSKAIEETQKKLLRKDAEEKPDYSYLCDRLDMLVKLKSVEHRLEYRKGDLPERVGKSMFGVERVAGEIDDFLTFSSTFKSDSKLNILLVGPPGSGKTSFAIESAYAAGAKEVCVIDLSVATPETLLGVSRNYSGARPSKIAETWMKNPDFAIIFDEIDKADPKIVYILLKILDGFRKLQEQYLEVDIPISAHIFATSNSMEIPLPIIDRFRVFRFETNDRIKEGAFDKVVEKMSAATEGHKLNIEVDSAAKTVILNKYISTGSIRELELIIGRIKEYLVANAADCDSEEITIKIDEEAVANAIVDIPYARGNIDTVPEEISGCVRGTAVTNDGMGMTFAIECMVYDSDKPTVEITGLAQEDTYEQVKLAVTNINARYGNILAGKSLHVHFAEGGVKKSGCSAGAATYIAILSAAIDVPVSRDIAITGEIGLHGGINAIGGAELKAAAAARDGCRCFVMPMENLVRISELDRVYLEERIELIGITHIDELIELSMPGIVYTSKLRKIG